MENRNLYTFKRVCELNSITKASYQLGYAQSTVTTQIKLLENELGVKLFERYGNTLHITRAGEQLLKYSNEIFLITNRFYDAMRSEKEVAGTLCIAAVDSVCMTILPELLKKFMQAYHEVNVKIISGVADKIKHDLSSGNADLAFILDFGHPSDDFYILLEKNISLGFYIAANVSLADFCLEKLKKQKFVLTEHNCQYRIRAERFFEERGMKPDVLMESSSTEAIMRIVASGLGVTYLPGIVADENAGLQRLPLETACNSEKLRLQLLIHKNKWKSALICEFIKVCESLW